MQKLFRGRNSKNSQTGFTLIEMAMVITIAGIIISIMVTVLPSVLKSGKIKESRAKLTKYDYALRGYAIANFRLPFADSDGDGLENNNSFVGSLPYATLGLSNGNDAWGNPVKYGVYGRNGDPNNLTDTTDKVTLCAALAAVAPIPGNVNFVYTTDTTSNNCAGGTRINQAFVIASGGPKDLDGNNGFFDLCTGRSGAGFNADNKIQASNYDDLVRSYSIVELIQQNCGP